MIQKIVLKEEYGSVPIISPLTITPRLLLGCSEILQTAARKLNDIV